MTIEPLIDSIALFSGGKEIAISVISTVFGGGVAAFLAFRINLKKQRLSEFEALIEEYKILRADLQTRVEQLEKELALSKVVEIKLREEILNLTAQLNQKNNEN